MSRTKEFFHGEITRMQEGENLLVDDAYMYSKWLLAQKFSDGQADASIGAMESGLEESEMPLCFHTVLG